MWESARILTHTHFTSRHPGRIGSYPLQGLPHVATLEVQLGPQQTASAVGVPFPMPAIADITVIQVMLGDLKQRQSVAIGWNERGLMEDNANKFATRAADSIQL